MDRVVWQTGSRGQFLLLLGALIGGGAGVFSPPDTNAQSPVRAPTESPAAPAKPKSLVWIPKAEFVGMLLTLALVVGVP